MMKSFVVFGMVATAVLSLAGCATTPPQVQAVAKNLCQYEPAASAVLKIAALVAPGASAASQGFDQVAPIICKAVSDTITANNGKKGLINPHAITATFVGADGKTHSVRLNGVFTN
jgi:hypothetical protein